MVIGDAAAGTAHREAGADDGRQADFFHRLARFVERFHHHVLGHREADFCHRLAEQQAVFRFIDALQLRADEFDIVFFKNATLCQRLRAVECRLAAHGRQQRVRAFARDDFLHELRRDRLDIGRIRQLRVGHDRRRIAVHQNHPEALSFQRFHRLRAGVIKLARLPDDNRPRADDEDGFDVGTFRH